LKLILPVGFNDKSAGAVIATVCIVGVVIAVEAANVAAPTVPVSAPPDVALTYKVFAAPRRKNTSGAKVELPICNSPVPTITKPKVPAAAYWIRKAGSAGNAVVISTGGATEIVPETLTLTSSFPEQSICEEAEFNINDPVKLLISLA
jgi:hypothetical protein